MTDQKWADIEADDDFEPELLSTNKGFETKPDKDGIKTVTKYITSENGTIKITKRVKVSVKSQRINKAVYARKNLPEFGIAKSEHDMDRGTTVISNEDLYIEMPKNAKSFRKVKADDDDFYCADLTQLKTTNVLKQKLKALRDDLDGVNSKSDLLDDMDDKPTKLIPSRLRGDGNSKFKEDRKLKEECTIRVTNLSEDVDEASLRELFGKVGNISRIYLAKHKSSQIFKGFAFVTYQTRQSAEAAIRQLNRHGYDNLLLNVEWAKPSNRS